LTDYGLMTSTTANDKLSLWRELVDAIRGSEADYTSIKLGRAIFLLAVPMILELVMESTFAVVDIYFVGKLGASAVATVGLTETYLFLVYALGMGLAMGVTAIVARRIGEKNAQDASVAAVQSILLGVLACIPFAIGGIFYVRELLELMGADAWALEHGYRYTQ
jgi:Na+-driven multidrug efflux pump